MPDEVFRILKVLEWSHEEAPAGEGGSAKADPIILRIHCENCSSEWKLNLKAPQKKASTPPPAGTFMTTKCPKCRAIGDLSLDQLNKFRK